MRLFKQGLRLFIASFSILGFFGGWALFAHAAKPAPAQPPSSINAPVPLALPTLVPDSNIVPGLQPLPSLPPSNSARSPRLRTRSS